MATRTELDLRRQLHRLRLPLLVFGGVTLALGLVTLVVPTLAERIPIAAILDRLGNDWVVVAIFGAAALVGVIGGVVARVSSGIDQATPPEPEDAHQGGQIGAEFDGFLADAGLRSWLVTERHQDIRSRLRAAAIGTVMRASNCRRAEARDQVDSGTWTDNEAAASFLAEPVELTVTDRLQEALSNESSFQRAARTTAAEIAQHDPEAEQ